MLKRVIPPLILTLRMQPRNIDLIVALGAAHAALNEFDEAIAALTRGIEVNPGNAELYFQRGNLHHRKGDREHAIADYQKALEIDPGNAEIRRALDRIQSSDSPAQSAPAPSTDRGSTESVR